MNGQEIAEELRKRKGTRPTAETLYPALKELRKKGLVQMEKKGRTTTYTLSDNGKEGLEGACRYFFSVFGAIFQEYSRA